MRYPTRHKTSLRLGKSVLCLGERTLVMGIINCTPDSFYDGGRYNELDSATARFSDLVAAGADLIDVGGESSRPGAKPVSADEEWRRIKPVLTAANQLKFPVPLSVDTTKYEVASRALDAGASIINDISALNNDKRLADLTASHRSGLVLMHKQGTPEVMQDNPQYDDLISELINELDKAIKTAEDAGVDREQIIIDPGIGFGKTVQHNLEIIRRLADFSVLRRPILMGCSRKSLIGTILGLEPEERLEGTLALHDASALLGAHIVRVHDVQPAVRSLRMIDAVLSAGSHDQDG